MRVTLLCLAPILAYGCIRETISTSSRPKILDFSDSIRNTALWPVGFPHGVNLIVELADGDLKKADQKRLHQDLYRAQPYRRGTAEVWIIGNQYELTYSNGRFQTGDFSYTARKRSRLFLFRERPGDFSFRFHEQDIVIKAGRKWKPSLLYSTVEYTSATESSRGVKPSRRSRPRKQTVWLGEILQIGTTTIRVDPRHGGFWTINERNYRPNPGRPLVLEGIVRFAE